MVNIHQVYRELDPEQPRLDQLTLMSMMAEWQAQRT